MFEPCKKFIEASGGLLVVGCEWDLFSTDNWQLTTDNFLDD
jgi:hypothetical protein